VWAIVQHAEWEGPGTIAAVMAARGIAHRICRMDRGEALPRAGEIAGLVVMGGAMGVYEAERVPHLKEEIALLGRMVAARRPVLGVCLGAQLLAAALGATVARGPAMESGAGEVELSEAGRTDPVLGGDGATALPVVHWHQDTFPLPEGAVRLASSAMYREQAFRFGERVYGLQFHLEVNDALAQAWREQGLALGAEQVAVVEAAGRRVWERFFVMASAV
jgi:GMP synthase (glutamine-hydrolysing)